MKLAKLFKQGPYYAESRQKLSAAIEAGKRLCGPLSWRDRPDFTCFQAGSETAAIARGEDGDIMPGEGIDGCQKPARPRKGRRERIPDQMLPLVRQGEDRFFGAVASYEYEMSSRDSVYSLRNLRPKQVS